MCILFYHSLFCVPLIMANRFGLTYNPSGLTNYIFPLPSPSPSSDLRMLGHTRIHKEVRDQGTKKREKRHAEQEVVGQKEERKQYVKSGSGHKSITSFCTPEGKPSSNVTASVTDCSKKLCSTIPTSPVEGRQLR